MYYYFTQVVFLLFFLVVLTEAKKGDGLRSYVEPSKARSLNDKKDVSGTGGKQPVKPSAGLTCSDGIKSVMAETLDNLIAAVDAFGDAATAFDNIRFDNTAQVARDGQLAIKDNVNTYIDAVTMYDAAVDANNVTAAIEALRDANAAALAFPSTLLGGGDDAGLVYDNAVDNVIAAAVANNAAAATAYNEVAPPTNIASSSVRNTYYRASNAAAVVAYATSLRDAAAASAKEDLELYDLAAAYQVNAIIVANAAAAVVASDDATYNEAVNAIIVANAAAAVVASDDATHNESSDVLAAYRATVRTYATAGKVATSAGRASEDLDGGYTGREAANAGELADAYDEDGVLNHIHEIVTTCRSSEANMCILCDDPVD